MALQGNKEQNSLPRDLYQIRISLRKVERNYEMKPENFHASDELIVSKKRKLFSVRSILKPCIS